VVAPLRPVFFLPSTRVCQLVGVPAPPPRGSFCGGHPAGRHRTSFFLGVPFSSAWCPSLPADVDAPSAELTVGPGRCGIWRVFLPVRSLPLVQRLLLVVNPFLRRTWPAFLASPNHLSFSGFSPFSRCRERGELLECRRLVFALC